MTGSFAATTQAAAPDTTPDAFSFNAQTGIMPGRSLTSNTIVPTGYNAPAPISISAGASYSINGGTFVTTPGTISPGQSVAVRMTCANEYNTSSSASLTIGGVTGTFAVTTKVQSRYKR